MPYWSILHNVISWTGTNHPYSAIAYGELLYEAFYHVNRKNREYSYNFVFSQSSQTWGILDLRNFEPKLWSYRTSHQIFFLLKTRCHENLYFRLTKSSQNFIEIDQLRTISKYSATLKIMHPFTKPLNPGKNYSQLKIDIINDVNEGLSFFLRDRDFLYLI